jgi:hypothetical protein
VAYTVLDSEFAASTMLKHGPDVVACWMLLLATTDKLGESYMQPSAAASLLRITDDRALRAFEILQAPDSTSKNREMEGRRIVRQENGKWLVVSHGKYQARASRSWATERQKAYLRRKKAQDEMIAADVDASERLEAFRESSDERTGPGRVLADGSSGLPGFSHRAVNRNRRSAVRSSEPSREPGEDA